MNNLIGSLIGPRINKFLVIGFILLVLGFLLTPILIGIPILMIGSLVFVVGVMIYLARILPGGDKIVSSFENLFSQMWSFL